jgi:VCBS repeat protein
MRRTNPNIIEEDETHFVERLPKKDYIRVDERHIRSPILVKPVEFYREDDDYYYLWTSKLLPEEILQAQLRRSGAPAPTPRPTRTPFVPLADFEELAPATATASVRFELLPDSGLPREGLWRASFVLADMNGDGIPDIVAPPARLGGDGKPHIWLGDGKGHFTAWPLTFSEDGVPRPDFSTEYGGIAAGDIDGDGKMDLATASHNGGIVALFGDGKGNFVISRKGLPQRDFSSQAIALIDVDGDGRPDIVASRDSPDARPESDLNQVRTYLYRSPRSWEFRSNSLPGAAYSYSMSAWDYDRDGKVDLLTGSHVFAAPFVLWKNGGKGEFAPIFIPELESISFHFATRPGSFGREKLPAFVDAYSKFMQEPLSSAVGVNVYSLKNGAWTVHRVFRKKGANTFLYAVAMGDLNGDGLDDVVFPDSDLKKVRIFLQSPEGRFIEIPAAQEPDIDSPAQCVRLADINGDGRLDIVVAKTVSSSSPTDPGGWSIYLNRP